MDQFAGRHELPGRILVDTFARHQDGRLLAKIAGANPDSPVLTDTVKMPDQES